MTVSVAVINCGNHPDDSVGIDITRASDNKTFTKTLAQGEWYSLHPDYKVTRTGEFNGSGEDSRNHTPVSLCLEGSGRSLMKLSEHLFHPSYQIPMSMKDSEKRFNLLIALLINEIELRGKDYRLNAMSKTKLEEAALIINKSVNTEVSKEKKFKHHNSFLSS